MPDATPSIDQTCADVMQVVQGIKHCQQLGIRAVEAGHGRLKLALPYSEAIIGNPETGVIHGGALTTLMDTACGFAAVLGLDNPAIAPTLDLRIDYMRSAIPGKTVIGDAVAYRVTSSVIFARGTAYHEDDPDSPIAHCSASFMRISDQAKAAEAAKKDGG
jgi:uncharacterized protein (TIGR00369 family)